MPSCKAKKSELEIRAEKTEDARVDGLGRGSPDKTLGCRRK